MFKQNILLYGKLLSCSMLQHYCHAHVATNYYIVASHLNSNFVFPFRLMYTTLEMYVEQILSWKNIMFTPIIQNVRSSESIKVRLPHTIFYNMIWNSVKFLHFYSQLMQYRFKFDNCCFFLLQSIGQQV